MSNETCDMAIELFSPNNYGYSWLSFHKDKVGVEYKASPDGEFSSPVLMKKEHAVAIAKEVLKYYGEKA